MATIKEIAKLAEVSTTTVSYVLNGTKKLTPETTKRVKDAIKKLNYSPNTVAQNLRKGTTTTIGVITEDIRRFPTPEIINGIGEKLEKVQYNMLVHDLRLYEKIWPDYEKIVYYKKRINRGIQLLQQSMVSGIIYVCMHDRKIGKLIEPIDIPIVYAYAYCSEEESFVTYDDFISAKQMTEHLINLGHKNIGVICGYSGSYPTQTRLKGIMSAMEKHNIKLPEEYIKYGDWEYESGMDQTRELLKMKNRPTAIFALNDIMAAGSYHAITEAGLKIPTDISVAGFDDRDIAQYMQPPLTTMSLPLKDLGNKALELLLDKITQEDTSPKNVIFPCNIIIRNSTDKRI